VHFNYLDRDALQSTIYRALETNAKVYKLSGCAETFSHNVGELRYAVPILQLM
jgi:hypothetical protein